MRRFWTVRCVIKPPATEGTANVGVGHMNCRCINPHHRGRAIGQLDYERVVVELAHGGESFQVSSFQLLEEEPALFTKYPDAQTLRQAAWQ